MIKEFEKVNKLNRADDLIKLVEKEPFNESNYYKVTYYGTCDYKYTRANLKAKPFPKYLNTLAKQMEELEQLPIGYFNMCLINKYTNGKGLGKHRDNEEEIGYCSTIASISLGADRIFSITKGYNGVPKNIKLSHGDVVMMRGRSQIDFYHEVIRGDGIRYNITFRHNPKSEVRKKD